MIEAKALTKIYKTAGEELVALNKVSVQVASGESLAIVGKSGSGKSTLMHTLATLDRPTSGSLKINGQEVTTYSTVQLERLRNKSFGFVFQQFFINPRSSCIENVLLPLMIMGISPTERNRRGQEILEKVGLGNKAKQKANDLSGGQKQRLCIARALITNPEVIFADEPTGNLDSETGDLITDMLFSLQQEQGITLIVVTHDDDLAKLCQRQLVIKDGQVVKEGRK